MRFWAFLLVFLSLSPSAFAQKIRPLIQGHCSIVEMPLDPVPGPCANLLLVLTDSNGKEVERTRTSAEGEFDFGLHRGQGFHIASGSRFFEVAEPQGAISGGPRIALRVRQK
jgi:hypothetical protein